MNTINKRNKHIQIIKLFFLNLLLFCNYAHANWLADIASGINNSNIITGNILKDELVLISLAQNSLATQEKIFTSQQQIETLMRDVNGDLTGHSGWGNYQFQDLQSYGAQAQSWGSVLSMANAGGGNGQFGSTLQATYRQFPIDNYAYSKGTSDTNQQKYYALQAQTVVSARAASELDYDKIQSQISYQQMLQQQIEHTKDLKAASDLSNRIQVEGNLINLELLRQIAVLNQQQAVSSQASVNVSLAHSRFLTK